VKSWKWRWDVLILALLTALAAPPLSAASLDLLTEAKKGDMTLYWDSFASKGMLEKGGRVVLFRAEDNLLVLDYESFALTDAPALDHGRLVVTQGFLDSVNAFFASAVRPTRPPMNFDSYRVGAIVIDAGHGGSDPGAKAEHVINGKKTPVLEKEINLAVAKKLNTILRRAYPDKKIIMTRTTDTYLSLEQRTNIANAVTLGEKEAILFVSIHVNSSINAKATGFEVWYLPENINRQVLDPGEVGGDEIIHNILNSMTEDEYIKESSLIAQFIMDGLNSKIGRVSPPRAVKEEAWAVVRNSKMPSVLVEIGFLSNAQEAALLMDSAHQQKTAQGIADGIDTFVRNFELSRGFTAKK
jgi:N-acetylmuramoyl-L-alanine amidase